MNARRHAAYVLAAALAAPLTCNAQVASSMGCADCAGSSAYGNCQGCQNGAAGCIGGPTPGPCTADGVCYPRLKTWGHYQGSWGRWPGDFDDPLPEGPRSIDEVEIPSTPVIKPQDEDREAPPAADDEAADDEGSESAEAEGPTVGDELPPLPPPRQLGAPPAGDDDDDPPPAFPGFNPPPAGGAGPGLLDGFSARPMKQPTPAIRRPIARTPVAMPRPLPAPAAAKAMDQDLPPALPAELQAVSQRVRQAAAYSQGPGYVTPLGALPAAPAYASPTVR